MLALPAAGCTAAVPLVTVDTLLAQCDAFKGKPVQLAGYLGQCSGYECYLAADKARWAALVSALDNTHGHQSHAKQAEAWSRANALWPIGVGGGEAFDRKAGPFQQSYVVISGTVAKDSCDGQGGTDRSSGISPTDIRAWKKSEGAPDNSK
ncbi:MAG: hypothetical protein ABIO86_21465 [Sphingomonas sp.]